MSVWIVFEYADYGNKIIGVYKNKEKAKKEYFELKRMLGINPKLETLINLKEN